MYVTPCISICELDKETRICKGCGRTQMEIFMWTKYTDEERIKIMRRLGYGRRNADRTRRSRHTDSDT